MAFKARRQTRYNKLKQAHFLPFEARSLSQLQSNNPFLKELIKVRRNTFRQSIKQFEFAEERFSKIEWKRIIYETYRLEGWIEAKRPDVLSPWAMYNDFKDRYRDKYPDWQEQYSKQKRRRQDFIPKLEGMKKAKQAKDAKYPRGRTY